MHPSISYSLTLRLLLPHIEDLPSTKVHGAIVLPLKGADVDVSGMANNICAM